MNFLHKFGGFGNFVYLCPDVRKITWFYFRTHTPGINAWGFLF